LKIVLNADVEREMSRSRCELLISAINKHKAKMPSILDILYILDDVLYAGNTYHYFIIVISNAVIGEEPSKEGRPFGLVALLIDVLDVKLAQLVDNYDDIFRMAANLLQRISVIGTLTYTFIYLFIYFDE
jgi:hypothetical protein